MFRLATLLGLLALPAFGPAAAPIPKHLMSKEPTFNIPMRVGATWVYEIDGLERTAKLTSVEDTDGAKLITMEWVNSDGTRTPHQVWAVSAKGVFMVAENGSAYDEPWCILASPHKDGQVWEIDIRQRGRRVQFGNMTAGPVERVKVPAGEFTAAKVVWNTDVSGTGTDWYADGIGLIRTDGRPMIVLKSFTPGKP